MNAATGPTVMRLLAALLTATLLLAACETGPDVTPTPPMPPTPTATVAPSPTPSPTASPTPSPTPTATPSPTPFVPPTVAVAADDSVQSCLENNLSAGLLISLSQGDDALVNDIIHACLETQIPSDLVFLLGPIIDQTSKCAVDESQTLSNTDLLALSGPDSDQKTQVVNRVTDDIVACVADHYHVPVSWFQ